jgi:2,4-diketo-3-deoxy-L-fuconate hydrolase
LLRDRRWLVQLIALSDDNDMKLLRYGLKGQERPGLLDGQGQVRDLSGVIDDIGGATLLPEALDRLRAIDISRLPIVDGTPQAGLRVGPCVANVGKFVCIGLNYSDHAAEAGMEVPAEPVVFGKWTSAICDPDDDIEIPRGSVKTDWEVELGVVIGKSGRDIREADAL